MANQTQRELSLENIRKVVNEIRQISGNHQLEKLYFNPKARNNYADKEIEFTLTEKMPNEYGNTITAGLESDEKQKKLKAVVEFDYNIHKPLTHFFTESHIDIVHANLKEYQRLLKSQFAVEPERNNPLTQKAYQNASNKAVDNFNTVLEKEGEIKNSMNKSMDKNLLRFITAHELAHISFKERNDIQFQYMDKAQLAGIDKKQLNDAIYSINRQTQRTQHQGANYMSTRDEIHSDIAGIYYLGLSVYKNNENEAEMRKLIEGIAKIRHSNNISADQNRHSSHNSNELFKPENINKLLNMAKRDARNKHNPNIYNELLDMTEDIFFETLKKDGIVFISSVKVGQELEKGIDRLNTKDVYSSMIKRTNPIGAEKFDSCMKNIINPNFSNICTQYLNGNQLNAVDTNKDGRPDHKTTSSAIGQQAANYQNNKITQEGINLQMFSNMNNIGVRATDNLGVDSVDIKESKIKFNHLQ